VRSPLARKSGGSYQKEKERERRLDAIAYALAVYKIDRDIVFDDIVAKLEEILPLCERLK